MSNSHRRERAELDHLVITAPNLAAGCEFVMKAIGVGMVPGGEHPLMGTQNMLARLNDSTFLEVIAVNPAACHPGRPRWFGLDRLPAGQGPRLATWVARTSNIEQVSAAALRSLGQIETMRRGSFQWRITVPADGELIDGGVVPALIQWESGQHPAAGLPESGCSLDVLELFTFDPESLRRELDLLGLSHAVEVSACRDATHPRLVAHVSTPAGKCSIPA